MIRKSVFFQKRFSFKKTASDLFREMMKKFAVKEESCTLCRKKGSCVRHGWYSRNVIDYAEDCVRYEKIRVLRVKCLNCGHTHAVLPDCIIPYATYSLFFILRIFVYRFLGKDTVMKICTKFQISVSVFYRWKHIFDKHKIRVPKNAGVSVESNQSFFQSFFQVSYSEFEYLFLQKNQHVFLQKHKFYFPIFVDG